MIDKKYDYFYLFVLLCFLIISSFLACQPKTGQSTVIQTDKPVNERSDTALCSHQTDTSRHLLVLKSDFLPENDTVLIYLPQSYLTTQKHFPVVFMLHGYAWNYRSYEQFLDLRQLADSYQFIIVCPDGLYDSWYIDSPIDSSLRFESFFIEELIPEILDSFCANPDQLFITGLSMGGHGAMYLFLKHPDILQSAGSSSGVLNLKYSATKAYSLIKRIGDYNIYPDRYLRFSAISQLDNISSKQPFIFDCGTQDYLLQANEEFKARCDSLNINYYYYTSDGGHDYNYWKQSIERHFEFFRQQIGQPLQDIDPQAKSQHETSPDTP